MTDSTHGQLINPDHWKAGLPDSLFLALSGWVEGQPFNLQLGKWYTEGESGSHVASVRIRPAKGKQTGAILKLIPKHGPAASRAVALAKVHTPPDFREKHLVSTDMISALPDSSWWVHLQSVAQTDLATMEPLGEFIDHPDFSSYCGTIMSSIVNEWNNSDTDDPPTNPHPPKDFLTHDLGERLPELWKFAQMAGIDPERPTPDITPPGHAGPLPNPFAVLSGHVEPCGGVEVFLGNGHGDLHPGNVLVPVDREPRPEAFRLIDLDRFSPATPVSRDPAKLILALAARWLPELTPYSTIRSRLAELIVAPVGYPRMPTVAGYLSVAEEIYQAAARWGSSRTLVTEWRRQHHLVLAASALRTVSRTDVEIEDRWWHLELAALAIRQLSTPGAAGGLPLASVTARPRPKPTRTPGVPTPPDPGVPISTTSATKSNGESSADPRVVVDSLTGDYQRMATLHTDGRYAEALHVLGAVIARLLCDRVRILLHLRRPDEAAEHLDEAIQLQRAAAISDDHPDRLAARHYLAAVLSERGQHADAKQEYEEVLKLRVKVLGDQHPDTLRTRYSLAGVLSDLGELPRVESELGVVLEKRLAIFGESHPDTALTRCALADLFVRQDRLPEAESQYEIALETCSNTLAEDHPDLLAVRHGLSQLYLVQGRRELANAELVRVLDGRRRALGKDHPDTKAAARDLRELWADERFAR